MCGIDEIRIRKLKTTDQYQSPGDLCNNAGLDALMCVRDDEFYPSYAPAGQLAQKLRPDRLSLGRADLKPKHFTASIRIDADGYDGRDRYDAAAASHLEVGGIDPDVGPFALNGSVEEGLTLISISSHSWDTWLLEMPDMPIALTRSSTERVEMP